eukprot:1970392-Lingulodinium_polyedra.AAC.1
MQLLELEIADPTSLVADVTTLVRHSLPGLTDKKLLEVLALRNMSSGGLTRDELPEAVWEDVGSKDDTKEVQDPFVLAIRSCCVCPSGHRCMCCVD